MKHLNKFESVFHSRQYTPEEKVKTLRGMLKDLKINPEDLNYTVEELMSGYIDDGYTYKIYLGIKPRYRGMSQIKGNAIEDIFKITNSGVVGLFNIHTFSPDYTGQNQYSIKQYMSDRNFAANIENGLFYKIYIHGPRYDRSHLSKVNTESEKSFEEIHNKKRMAIASEIYSRLKFIYDFQDPTMMIQKCYGSTGITSIVKGVFFSFQG